MYLAYYFDESIVEFALNISFNCLAIKKEKCDLWLKMNLVIQILLLIVEWYMASESSKFSFE